MGVDMSILSRVGIGSATVDTEVPERVQAGETVPATVEVDGGSSAQEIDGVYFALETRYRRDEGSSEAVIGRFQLTDSFTIDAGAERTMDVDIEIPRWTPVTRGRTEVWIETGLDIDWALDPDDTDYLDVEPTDRLARVFDAVAELGFELKTAEPEAVPTAFATGDRPFVQELDFVPTEGPFRGDLDEIDLLVQPTAEELAVYLEVDPRESITAELTNDVPERIDEVVVREEPADDLATEFRRLLERSL
jgi:sporulation-control protein